MPLSTSWTLLEQLRIRDNEGWCRFVRLYTPLILNWCKTYGLQHADCELVASDVFLTVFNQINEFIPGKFRRWLRSIARHMAFDRLRQKARSPTSAVRLPELADPDGDKPLADQHWQETKLLYARAMQMVCASGKNGELQWEILEKVLIQGIRPDDVAREYGYETNSVYRMLQRVLKRLRRDFRKMIEPDE